jgi:hypothetical protein
MSYSAEVLADSPLLYWRLGDPTGTFADSSGNSRTAADTSGLTHQVTGALVGDSNLAVDLDGTNGSLVSSYNPFTAASSRTFEGISWRDTSTNAHALMGGTTGTRVLLRCDAGSTNVTLFTRTDGASQTWTAAWPGNGQYVHWDLTYNDTSKVAELWINGVSQGTKTMASAYSGSDVFVVGGSGALFDGKMDEIAVYSAILTSGRIAAHVAAINPPAVANTIEMVV